MRPWSGGGAPGAIHVRILVSNSVTSDAVFAGNGQKSACRHAATWWPRGGGPLSRLFYFYFLLCVVFFLYHQPHCTSFGRHHGHHDITMQRIARHSDLCGSGKSGNENSLTGTC